MADSTSLVITLHGDDDVAIARGAIAAGTVLHELDGLLVANDIPAAHKVALRALQAGDPVRRYGQIIGFATQPIEPGRQSQEIRKLAATTSFSGSSVKRRATRMPRLRPTRPS